MEKHKMSTLTTISSSKTEDKIKTKCMYCSETANKWLVSYNKPSCSVRHYARANWKMMMTPFILISLLSYYLRSIEASWSIPIIIPLVLLAFIIYGNNIDRFENKLEFKRKLSGVEKERNRAYTNFLLNLKTE